MFWKRVALNVGCALITTMLVHAQESATATTPAAESGESLGAPAKKSGATPQKSLKKTIEQAIKSLEAYDCVTVAVDFLSPIKRAQIPDLVAYSSQRRCSAQNKGNLDEALLAMKLARNGIPEYRGATATISLEGVGLNIQKVTLVKYIDGKWYFNDL